MGAIIDFYCYAAPLGRIFEAGGLLCAPQLVPMAVLAHVARGAVPRGTHQQRDPRMMRKTPLQPGDPVWVVVHGDDHYGDIAIVSAISDEDPDGAVVRFDGDAELYAFDRVELKVLQPGDAVRVVAKDDQRHADMGTVYAIPDEDDVIVKFDDASEPYAFRRYELKAIGADEVTDSSTKIAAIMVTCSNGHSNPDHQHFCGECGVPLAPPTLQCPHGHINRAHQRFCGECGTPLLLEQSPARREKRRVEKPTAPSPPPSGGVFEGRPKMIEGRAGWWANLTENARRTIIIGAVGLALLVAVILTATKPWESQREKDCNAAMSSEGYKGAQFDTAVKFCVDTGNL
jgi:hypothetical protein